jgi:hypothetical protein
MKTETKAPPNKNRPAEADNTDTPPPSGSGESADHEDRRHAHEDPGGGKKPQPNNHWAHAPIAFAEDVTGTTAELVTKLEQLARTEDRILCVRVSEPSGLQKNSAGHLHHWQQIPDSHIRLRWILPFRELGSLEDYLPADWDTRCHTRYHNVCLGLIINKPEDLNQVSKFKEIPAKLRMILIESVTEPLDMEEHLQDGIDWVVVEAGKPDHVRPIRDACREAGVAFYYGGRAEVIMTLDGESHHAHPFGDQVDLDRPAPLHEEFAGLLVNVQAPAPAVESPGPAPEPVQTTSGEPAPSVRLADETVRENGAVEGAGADTDQASAPLPSPSEEPGVQPPVQDTVRAMADKSKNKSVVQPRQTASSLSESPAPLPTTAPDEEASTAPPEGMESIESPDDDPSEAPEVPAAQEPETREVDVDVDDAPLDVSSAEMEQEIAAAAKVLEMTAGKAPDDLLDDLKTYAGRAETFAANARQAGHFAIANAWITGNLLNVAKKGLDHGKFGPWLDEHLVKTGALSKSTAGRWMKLAREKPDLGTLLTETPTLRKAYLATGILPTPERGEGVEKKPDAGDQHPHTDALLVAFNCLQKRLRLFTESGEELGPVEQAQVKAAQDEINRRIDEILACGGLPMEEIQNRHM